MPPRLPDSVVSASGEPRGVDLPGRSLDDLRRSNLSSVLRAVHLDNGCTRAEITRATGLNRSTVRALVADLVQAGIVLQDKPEGSGGMGRPSSSVFASDEVRVLAVNPEVDATVGMIVGLGGRVLARAEIRHASSPSAEDVVAAVGDLVQRLAPEGGLRGIAVAVPGLVDKLTGDVVVAPHLGWRNVPLAALLTETQGIRVVVDNDANCGVVAEYLFGAGRGCDVMVYLNGGASGIGGAAIVEGGLLAGADGFAGEFGHTLVNTVGRVCDCGATGCLETEVNRAGLIAALDGVSPASLDHELRLQGNGGLVADTSRAVTEADRQLRFLGVALRTVVNVMNPRRILLGGFLASMVNARGFELIHTELFHAVPGGESGVEVATAGLGGDILAIGAAQLILRQVIDDPLNTRALPAQRT